MKWRSEWVKTSRSVSGRINRCPSLDAQRFTPIHMSAWMDGWITARWPDIDSLLLLLPLLLLLLNRDSPDRRLAHFELLPLMLLMLSFNVSSIVWNELKQSRSTSDSSGQWTVLFTPFSLSLSLSLFHTLIFTLSSLARFVGSFGWLVDWLTGCSRWYVWFTGRPFFPFFFGSRIGTVRTTRDGRAAGQQQSDFHVHQWRPGSFRWKLFQSLEQSRYGCRFCRMFQWDWRTHTHTHTRLVAHAHIAYGPSVPVHKRPPLV